MFKLSDRFRDAANIGFCVIAGSHGAYVLQIHAPYKTVAPRVEKGIIR